jgi:glutamate/aspartate transport system permease protein
MMDWHVVLANAPLLLRGLATSLRLTGIAIGLSFPLGCLLAIGRLSRRRWLSRTCGGFVNLMRSNPLILVMFWFIFLVPLIIGRRVPDLTSVIVAFVIFFSVYFAEIVRSGIQAVSRRQIQAGLSTGLTNTQTMRHIVLPQAIRAMLPALTTQCIVVFQGTTVASIVGYEELLHTASMIAERTVRPVELYVAIAVIYFAVCLVLSLVSRRFEKTASR